MVRSHSSHGFKAAAMLMLATAFWGTTFLVMKALGQSQHDLVPGNGTWFFASLSLLARFGIGALILLVWNLRTMRGLTGSELVQGLGLGLFGGAGLVLQMDGVQHTPASTSAFLTQCYCIIVPVYVALRRKQWPPGALIVSCLMVLAGVGVLADIDWAQARLGRGEAETILASILFAAQILWLERPDFSHNRTGVVTAIMFTAVAAMMAPIVAVTTAHPLDSIRAFASTPTSGMTIYLTIACTIVACSLMNHWQRHLTSTHASLIYCAEPLFTSVFALFLPAILSKIANIDYANETLTTQLMIGGGLITAANIVVFWHATRMPAPQPTAPRKLREPVPDRFEVRSTAA